MTRSPANASAAVTLFVVLAFGAVSVLVAGCGTGDSDVSSTISTAGSGPTPAVTDLADPETPPPASEPPAPADVTLFDFADPASVTGWSTQNDTVMGGVSSATVGWSAGALVFSGDLSLANNGGFASAVSPPDPVLGVLATQAEVVVVEGMGDGRSYVMQLRGGRGGQQRWTQSFTLPGVAGQSVLPIGRFTATDFRLDPVAAEPVDPSTLVGISIYLVDNQAGPFQLSVTRLAVR
jgi:hypothetical protein